MVHGAVFMMRLGAGDFFAHFFRGTFCCLRNERIAGLDVWMTSKPSDLIWPYCWESLSKNDSDDGQTLPPPGSLPTVKDQCSFVH